jgi:hypothetical protein
MKHNGTPIGSKANIELDPVGSRTDSVVEGGKRILRDADRCPTVSDDFRH